MSNNIIIISEENLEKLSEQLLSKLQHNFQPIPVQVEDKTDTFLNVDQVAELLNLKKATIYSKVSKNSIPFIKKGKLLLFSKADILQWLQKSKHEDISDVSTKVNNYLFNNKFIG